MPGLQALHQPPAKPWPLSLGGAELGLGPLGELDSDVRRAVGVCQCECESVCVCVSV